MSFPRNETRREAHIATIRSQVEHTQQGYDWAHPSLALRQHCTHTPNRPWQNRGSDWLLLSGFIFSLHYNHLRPQLQVVALHVLLFTCAVKDTDWNSPSPFSVCLVCTKGYCIILSKFVNIRDQEEARTNVGRIKCKSK